MSIKLTQYEYWTHTRKREMEITPQNFEEIKESFISYYLEELETDYKANAEEIKAWLKIAKSITLEALETYINLEYLNGNGSSYDFETKYFVKIRHYNFFVISGFRDFIEYSKEGWSYGEFDEGSYETGSPSYEIKGEK